MSIYFFLYTALSLSGLLVFRRTLGAYGFIAGIAFSVEIIAGACAGFHFGGKCYSVDGCPAIVVKASTLKRITVPMWESFPGFIDRGQR